MSEHLALLGGEKVITKPLTRYNSIGTEELDAASKVISSGNLSQFVGSWCDDFYGGPYVREFESACCDFFGVKYAIAVNSWTSGLIAAIGAIDIEPGDEVIVPTWTMCASATSILHWNAIPVFADIEPDSFNISPDSIRNLISPYTKAILAVDIFGQSCNISKIMAIAKEYNLKVITDTAQSPGSLVGEVKTGTVADIGGFSLNYHKHIHTGEGGILVTNNSYYAERLQLIRNHGEAVVGDAGIKNINNIVGYNFRLGEIEAAIGIQQLNKLDSLVKSRQCAAQKLTDSLSLLHGIDVPFINSGSTHSYYIYPIKVSVNLLGVSRKTLVQALKAEGISEGLNEGYANIHMLPMYQNRVAYGKNGFPWTSDICNRFVDYGRGSCPVAEELHNSTFISFEMCLYRLSDNDVDLICRCFNKVWKNLDELRAFEASY